MERRVDIAILGASLAGASLALHLERLGISAVIADRESFPRHKPCGEGLSVLGVRELDALGLGDCLRRLTQAPFSGFGFIEKAKRSRLALALDRGAYHGIGIERYVLDGMLVERLRANKSTELFLGVETPVARQRGGDFLLHTPDGSYRARYLAIATGANPRLPRLLGVPEVRRGEGRSGIRVPLRFKEASVPGPLLVELLLDEGMQTFFTRIGESTANFCVLFHPGRREQLRLSRMPELVERMADAIGIEAEPAGEPLSASGIGRSWRPAHHGSTFLLGDAIQQLDPIGGMGMTQALISGRVTAETLGMLLRGRTLSEEQILLRHRRKMKAELSTIRAYTALSYLMLVQASKVPVFRSLKAGGIAEEVLLGIHREPSWREPREALARLVLLASGASSHRSGSSRRLPRGAAESGETL